MIDVLGLLADRSLDAHTSIVLTYNLDLGLYDGLLRRRFRRAGVASQMVFCDFTAYQACLDAIASAPRVGRAYSVTPVRLPDGAFHPKVYLVLGRSKGRLIVGSGNTSIGGLLRNAELFGCFDYDEGSADPPDAAFGVCVELIRELGQRAPTPVQRQIERAMAWSPWLSRSSEPSSRYVVVSGPGRRPLIAQVDDALVEREVQHVTVLTASFDRKLAALDALAARSVDATATCIVQSDVVDIDGTSVRRLGARIDWRGFVDPVADDQSGRYDARAHAKLVVFACEEDEAVVYGSANASAPAWVSARNVEVSVILPHAPLGSTLEALALSTSVQGSAVRDELLGKTWPRQDRRDAEPLALLSVTVNGSDLVLDIDGDVPGGVDLAVARGIDDTKPLRGPLGRRGEHFVAGVAIDAASTRVASLWHGRKRVSNWVALTWPDVARVSAARWFGAKVESALIAMQDGMVIGTVLFELLDRVRDFDVVYARKSGARRDREDVADNNHTVETEAFYTDATPDDLEAGKWVGDRTDLDLLAALVQPLSGVSTRQAEDDEEDDDDDDALAEEAERRAIDAQKGKATGDEKFVAGVQPSRGSLERAVRRLGRRLDRAAASVETVLDLRQEITTIPAHALARQIWMTHIGAFLAGRELEASDGSEVTSLDPLEFADYVLRVCRAMAGGRHGGLLSLGEESTWEGHDGEALRRGLAFLWSCVIWATALVDEYWALHADEDEVANGPWDAAPWLVAARFVNAVRECCEEPDVVDIERRIPAWADFDPAVLDDWTRRIDHLARFVERVEAGGRPATLESPAPRKSNRGAGALVFTDGLGVTAILEKGEDGKVYLLNLSRHGRYRAAYVEERVHRLVAPHEVGTLRWRAIAAD